MLSLSLLVVEAHCTENLNQIHSVKSTCITRRTNRNTSFTWWTKLVKYDVNNAVSLNSSASKAATSAVVVGAL